MKRATTPILIASVFVLGLSSYGAGFYEGSHLEPAEPAALCTTDAACDDLDREYQRVVAAIARTMRCSTEEEHAKGLDHECDPSEIEQDAGLVDEQGRIVR